jgi:hypothetical protein
VHALAVAVELLAVDVELLDVVVEPFGSSGAGSSPAPSTGRKRETP